MNDKINEPVHLVEDQATGDRFLVYGSDKDMRLDIRFEGENLWMTQAQIATLFGRDRSVISKHISGIFSDDELEENSNVQKLHIAHSTKPVSIFSLDLIISVGYRVSSTQATAFRRWATGILVQYAKKGFVVDSVRLKNPENVDRVKELRDIIRDIRSDEANVYRELLSICAMCQDYTASSEAALTFYKHTQAKLIYAVTSCTPAELIANRVDHEAPDMGLQSWSHDNIRKTDVTISKNYLVEREIKELNRLTTILLDIFEDQLDVGRLVVMADAQSLLDTQLGNLGRAVLNDGGQVSKGNADKKATAHYLKFKNQQKQIRHEKADRSIQELAKSAKELPAGRRQR